MVSSAGLLKSTNGDRPVVLILDRSLRSSTNTPINLVKVTFKNSGTEDIFNGLNSKAARKICPELILRVAVRKLDQIDSVPTVDELNVPPGNRLEMLAGERAGQYSIRINDQYRVCFFWSELGVEEVEIVDYH